MAERIEIYRGLIATADSPRLGPERRDGTKPSADLNGALDQFFAEFQVAPRAQPLLRSAAMLWHDHLGESHALSQNIETRDGSWLHGIMHRREPDYGNAKYWFRRVGQHEAFPRIAERAAKFLHNDSNELTERLIENGEWMPLAFIDECERVAARPSPDDETVLRGLQAIELDVLVEHIFATC